LIQFPTKSTQIIGYDEIDDARDQLAINDKKNLHTVNLQIKISKFETNAII
jgi:hypothetical protein